MRITPPTLAIASLLLMVSSVGHSQRLSRPINPRSVVLTQLGDAALVQPNGANDAADAYETALAIDPQNRAALIGLARASMKQELPGKAIRYYREALVLLPDDTQALEGQGEAMVAKGAFAKANENLAKIKTLCVGTCPEQIALSDAIARATAVAPVSAAQLTSKPLVTEGAN